MALGFKLIIFDFDGTLADTFDEIIDAVENTHSELALPRLPRDQIKSFIGNGIAHLLKCSTGYSDKEDLAQTYRIFSKHYRLKLGAKTTLYPGVNRILSKYRDLLLTIFSNKSRVFLMHLLEKLQIGKYFSDVLSGDDVRYKKPNPHYVHRLLDKNKIKPQEALIVGDMAVDIATGKAAGITTCAITAGLSKTSELEDHAPDYLIDNFEQLDGIIDG